MARRSSKGRKAAERRTRNKALWGEYRATLRALAKETRKFAVSHRNFDGGTALLAIDGRGNPTVITGANYKPHSGKRRHRKGDYCGEMDSIWKARRMLCEEVVGIVVECPHQPDDVSGRDFGVTVSCGFCREVYHDELKRRRSPLRRDTRLLFVHPGDPTKDLPTTIGEFLSWFPNDPKWVAGKGGV